jgi:uncharacterized protein YydD (DUF2326 family)
MKVLYAIAAAAVTAGPVYADCSYPAPPEKLPDGNSATLDEMVSAQKALKEYNKAIESYVSCIKLEHDSAASKVGDKPSPEQKKALDDMERVEVQKHNAAIDQLQSVANRFNEQVRLFKAKHKDEPKG